jgi:primary-amine oxidase
VTQYRDDELFPAGRFTMQSAGGEGIASWIERRVAEAARLEELVAEAVAAGLWAEEPERRDGDTVNGVRDTDIVVWHTFGSTHNPRAEDWPVMPVEKMVVGLKPVNFFERNPALDVAMSTQARNLSVLVGEEKGDGETECCEGGSRGR